MPIAGFNGARSGDGKREGRKGKGGGGKREERGVTKC